MAFSGDLCEGRTAFPIDALSVPGKTWNFVGGTEQDEDFCLHAACALCLRALRILGVFRWWDRVLRLFFHPDLQIKAPLTFDFAGVRYPSSTGYLVD